jgi:molybdopterin-guanine dinucleotide biosynthesis protein A
MLRVGGVVLCGGQSSRMGRPKAWLPFAGGPLLGWVVRLLGEAVSPCVVVAAPEQDLPSLPDDVLVVRDLERGRGPLQGLAAGLEAMRGWADAAYVSSCDAPFLRPAFVRRMIELLGEHAACMPRVGGLLHPLAAVYRLQVAEAAARLLAEGRRRTTLLADAVSTRIVRTEELADVDPDLESLRNLNNPEEYQAALHDAGKRGEAGK